MRSFVHAVFPRFRGPLIASLVLGALYNFIQPTLSDFLNKYLENEATFASPTGLCTVPPDAWTCLNGANATQLLELQGRSFMCGCGQGALGQNVCPSDPMFGYTISAYIATAPATFLFYLLSLLPLAGMVWVQFFAEQALPGSLFLRLARCTLASFLIFYNLFLLFSYCVFPTLHTVAVLIFVASAILHYVLFFIAVVQAMVLDTRNRVAVIIFINVAIVLIDLGYGAYQIHQWQTSPETAWPYGWWLAECIGLAVMFGIAPQLMLLGYELKGDPEEKEDEEDCTCSE